MISILADKNLFQLEQFIPSSASLHTFDPTDGLPEGWHQYEALFIRTVTRIDAELFQEVENEKLQFIGSGSAGIDHVDPSVLERRGIQFAHAPGCNARSVAEYVLTALLMWSDRRDVRLSKRMIGIVGAGHVGTAVSDLLQAFGIRYRLYDPPRDLREQAFNSCGLEEVLDTDILTLHTPLTNKGRYPTNHWLDQSRLENRNFYLVLNTARGGVVDENALHNAYKEGKVDDFILDVWEHEPRFNDKMAQQALFRTPHIAGYSHQAKLRASRMICSALASHFDLETPPTISSISEGKDPVQMPHSAETLFAVLSHLHPLTEYQRALDQLVGLSDEEKEYMFNRIRTGRTYRNEFAYISVPDKLLNQFPFLRKLGIHTKRDR